MFETSEPFWRTAFLKPELSTLNCCNCQKDLKPSYLTRLCRITIQERHKKGTHHFPVGVAKSVD